MGLYVPFIHPEGVQRYVEWVKKGAYEPIFRSIKKITTLLGGYLLVLATTYFPGRLPTKYFRHD